MDSKDLSSQDRFPHAGSPPYRKSGVITFFIRRHFDRRHGQVTQVILTSPFSLVFVFGAVYLDIRYRSRECQGIFKICACTLDLEKLEEGRFVGPRACSIVDGIGPGGSLNRLVCTLTCVDLS